MHAFPACLQDLGSISRSNLHVRNSHGRQLSEIGWQAFSPDCYAQTQSKVKVQLSEQFSAQNIYHSISSSRWRELITRAKFWKLMSTQILTPKSKFIDSHRNKDQNPAQDTRGSKGKPLIPTESYHDDEVEFGEIRVPYSSQSTIT